MIAGFGAVYAYVCMFAVWVYLQEDTIVVVCMFRIVRWVWTFVCGCCGRCLWGVVSVVGSVVVGCYGY